MLKLLTKPSRVKSNTCISQPHHISRSRQATLKLDAGVIAGMCEDLDLQGSLRGFRGVSVSERNGGAWG